MAQAVREHLHARLVGPLVARYEASGAPSPQLRAEVAVAAFTGVVLARGAGALTTLAGARDEDVAGLVEELLAGLG